MNTGNIIKLKSAEFNHINAYPQRDIILGLPNTLKGFQPVIDYAEYHAQFIPLEHGVTAHIVCDNWCLPASITAKGNTITIHILELGE